MPTKTKPKKSAQKVVTSQPKTARGTGWRKGSDLQPQELTLSSGAVCLVAFPDMEQLIKAGITDRIDVLTRFVDEKLVKPAKPGGRDAKSLTTKDLTIQDQLMIYELADRITCAVVVDPEVVLAPTPKCEVCGWEDPHIKNHKPADGHDLAMPARDPEAYYTDGISFADKMDIVNFVIGGPQALSRFLGESDKSMESVAAEPVVAGASE